MTPLTWVAASPDGSMLGVGSESGRFIVWSLPDQAVSHSFETGDFVVRARWTPDGKRLLVTTFDGPLLVRSGNGREALGQIEMRHHRLRDLGSFVAAFSDDHAEVFDSSGDLCRDQLGFPFYFRSPKPEWNQGFIVSGACFVPRRQKEHLVATSHFDGKVRLWRDGILQETLVLG